MKKTLVPFILLIASLVYINRSVPLSEYIPQWANQAGVFFVQSITVSDLKTTYKKAENRRDKVKVLLVAGHEPHYGGTQYGGLKERDVAVDLAEEIKKLLDKKSEYKVFVSRDKEKWNPDLENYFIKNWETITPWKDAYQREMVRLFNTGQVKQVTDGVLHNDAPPDVARRLYGINKWVNENGLDIVIHIHFNDYPRKKLSNPGVYKGFAIYIPEGQYSNAEATKAVAEKIHSRLSKSFSPSNLPKENAGLVEDQELVAIGRHNTVDAVSLLIEYAYIYEPWLHDPALREKNIKQMALDTYLGLEDFF
ncbi:MAG: N-acetylmuramoyl-L-alanine amidase [Candidatus Pacebacteria bacterium]|jgi:N-acetylmuramoyl-L-alanine amidase|nr:N-acetylmuramoyl-L-alanine amidase [Candidatus Paceibacterota bacterium]